MYIYGDETGFDSEVNGKKEKFIGYGVLYVQNSIEDFIIHEALENLRKDPKTLEIEYIKRFGNVNSKIFFHASEDSNAAHDHLLTCIRKHIKAKMNYTYIQEKTHQSTYEQIIRQTLKESVLNIFARNTPVNIYVERRDKFKIDSLEKVIEEMRFEILRTWYMNPFMIYCFPKRLSFIVGKENPGTQILDFILWATNRNYRTPKDERYFKQLPITTNSIGSKNYGTIRMKQFKDPEGILDLFYPGEVIDEVKNLKSNNLETEYSCIEEKVSFFLANRLPSNVDHLETYLINLKKLNQIADKKITDFNSILDLKLEIFLMLLHTMPLVDSTSSNVEMIQLLKAKLLATQLIGIPGNDFFQKRQSILDRFYLC